MMDLWVITAVIAAAIFSGCYLYFAAAVTVAEIIIASATSCRCYLYSAAADAAVRVTSEPVTNRSAD